MRYQLPVIPIEIEGKWNWRQKTLILAFRWRGPGGAKRETINPHANYLKTNIDTLRIQNDPNRGIPTG